MKWKESFEFQFNKKRIGIWIVKDVPGSTHEVVGGEYYKIFKLCVEGHNYITLDIKDVGTSSRVGQLLLEVKIESL